MIRLLKIELKKAFSFNGFWVILGIHAGLFILVSVLLSNISFGENMVLGQYFAFGEVWNSITWLASWFNILLGILVIIMIGNEFHFRTFRQHVIDGLSKSNVFAGKALLIAVLAVYGLMLVLLSSLIYGSIFTVGESFELILQNSYFLAIFFLQALGYMSFAMMIIILIRNTGLSILAFILYMLIVESIIGSFFHDKISTFFPGKIISSLTPMPDFIQFSAQPQMTGSMAGAQYRTAPSTGFELGMTEHLLMAGFYIVIFWLLSIWIVRKRDL
ncbi:MAG: hypothetical protein C0594_13650 [Marinilabiliales bacterium]|nr:MAG: hypothetical protein C0594_13650 [Marinilabiliales bacterium]